jgi:hypothetical protein
MRFSSRAVNFVLSIVGIISLIVLAVFSQKNYAAFQIVDPDDVCSNCGDFGNKEAVEMVKQILSMATTAAIGLFGGLAFVAVKTPQYARAPLLYAGQRALHLIAAISLLTALHYCFVMTHVLSVRFVDKIVFIGSHQYNVLINWIYYSLLIGFLVLVISILLLAFDKPDAGFHDS